MNRMPPRVRSVSFDIQMLSVFSMLSIGCIVAAGNSGSDQPSVNVVSVGINPDTVEMNGTFDVDWNVTYTIAPGVLAELGLYLGTSADFQSPSTHKPPMFFNLADTAGAPNHPGRKATCTRSASSVKCNDIDGSVTVPAGKTAVVFRACSYRVLDSDNQVCQTRDLSITFP